jgi:hypothetical protein
MALLPFLKKGGGARAAFSGALLEATTLVVVNENMRFPLPESESTLEE